MQNAGSAYICLHLASQTPLTDDRITLPMVGFEEEKFQAFNSGKRQELMVRLEELGKQLATYSLHRGILEKPDPDYQDPYREGRHVKIRYGDYMGLSGTILRESKSPQVHIVKLSNGKVAEIGDDLMDLQYPYSLQG